MEKEKFTNGTSFVNGDLLNDKKGLPASLFQIMLSSCAELPLSPFDTPLTFFCISKNTFFTFLCLARSYIDFHFNFCGSC